MLKEYKCFFKNTLQFVEIGPERTKPKSTGTKVKKIIFRGEKQVGKITSVLNYDIIIQIIVFDRELCSYVRKTRSRSKTRSRCEHEVSLLGSLRESQPARK